eukprot:g25243.t1
MRQNSNQNDLSCLINNYPFTLSYKYLRVWRVGWRLLREESVGKHGNTFCWGLKGFGGGLDTWFQSTGVGTLTWTSHLRVGALEMGGEGVGIRALGQNGAAEAVYVLWSGVQWVLWGAGSPWARGRGRGRCDWWVAMLWLIWWEWRFLCCAVSRPGVGGA